VEHQLFKTTICNLSSSITDRGFEIVTRGWGGTGFSTRAARIGDSVPTRIEQSTILRCVESRERIGSVESTAGDGAAGAATL